MFCTNFCAYLALLSANQLGLSCNPVPRYTNVTALKTALALAAAGSAVDVKSKAEAALSGLPPLPGKLLLHTSSALDKREAALSSWLEPPSQHRIPLFDRQYFLRISLDILAYLLITLLKCILSISFITQSSHFLFLFA
jgi:hypothetical protein